MGQGAPSKILDGPGALYLGGINVFTDRPKWFLNDADPQPSSTHLEREEEDDDNDDDSDDVGAAADRPRYDKTKPADYEHGVVTHVLTMCKLSPSLKPSLQKRRIVWKHCQVEDDEKQQLTPLFCDTSEFIHRARLLAVALDARDSTGAATDASAGSSDTATPSAERGAIYCHCVAGVSRSSTTVCAYLMAWLDLSFEDALMFARSKRSCVLPNPGFKHQLNLWESSPQRLLLRDKLRSVASFPGNTKAQIDTLLARDLKAVQAVVGS